MVSQQRILIHEDSMNLLSLYTSPSLPNITLGLPAVPTQLNVSHYTAAQVIFSEGISLSFLVYLDFRETWWSSLLLEFTYFTLSCAKTFSLMSN